MKKEKNVSSKGGTVIGQDIHVSPKHPEYESRWVDKEFSALLKQANGTLDIEKRRQIFAKLEKIQMDRGSIANAFWINMWTITRKNVENIVAHPNAYLKADDIWLNA
jgi:peptide/nickel transport system substrate-binding protein